MDDIVEKETEMIDFWYKSGLVEKYLKKNQNSDKNFSFLDGPITANNPMGVHHGWGRTYKDVFQRYFSLKGYKQRFQNGFDCQGLWVEVEVEKELGLKSKKDIENLVEGDKSASIAKFIQLCKDRVKKYAQIQTDQSKRLGYLMDWDNSYFTMSDANNYAIWYFLKKCYENDWIYKGNDAVPWCPRCGTAISQHEMLTEDYKELTHQSIYFSLPLKDSERENLLVWTTTPWTLPGNVAVAVDPEMNYVLLQPHDTNELFWVAESSQIISSLFKEAKIVKTMKGSYLVDKKYEYPFSSVSKSIIVDSDSLHSIYSVISTDVAILPISTEEGTGMVHIAPGAGTEDFALAKKKNLPVIELIDESGNYLDKLANLATKNATKNPEFIFSLLEQDDTTHKWIFKIVPYTHRYPACWRCKTELVWRVVDEWYIAMDKPTKVNVNTIDLNENVVVKQDTLRQRLMRVAKTVNWIPDFGLDRELDWLSKMHDWMISKKRFWGLALPIWVCENCSDFRVIGSKSELKSAAIEGMELLDDHTPHRPYVDEIKIKCEKCSAKMYRIADVGNPWLDAGIVPFSTIAEKNTTNPAYFEDKKYFGDWFPVDFITESFPGQFKNWFYSLLVMSTVLEDVAPFKTVLGFATCLAEDGRPMHKSWGNSIEFHEGSDKIGVDVMRWMYCATNPSLPLLFGYKKGDDIRRNIYLTLLNCFKYLNDNSNKSQGISHEIDSSDLTILDTWILNRVNQVISQTDKSYSNYDLADVCEQIAKLIQDISTWFIRRSRDRASGENGKKSQEIFFDVLSKVLKNVAIISSPIMPFLTNEIYISLTGDEAVFLSDWPKIDQKIDTSISQQMELVRQIASIGQRVRKESTVKLRQPLNSVKISLNKNDYESLGKIWSEINYLLIDELNVKSIELISISSPDIQVEYDFVLSEELRNEGIARDIIRSIQVKRKQMGLSPETRIDLTLSEIPAGWEQMIKEKVKANKIDIGAEVEITIIN